MSWFITQSVKVFLGIIREKRFNFRWFVGTGGMPSSHSAFATSLAVLTGLYNGFDSAIFAVALIFTFIVMFDAQGVRRASGQQAEILNKMLDDIYWSGHVKEDRLKELLGHTPLEVLTGSVFGILNAFLFYK